VQQLELLLAALQESGSNRNALNFEHDVRPREPGHGNGCASRKVVTKQLCSQLSHSGGVANVDQKYRHRNNVGQLASASGQRLFDIVEGLIELRIEIAGERTAILSGSARVTGEPYDCLLAFRDDSW
jgi:hypothetical protein